jgi:hypothetical protein
MCVIVRYKVCEVVVSAMEVESARLKICGCK